MLNFTVNGKRCTRCGQCVRDCPSRIIEREGKELPRIAADKETLCIQCQHCLAVCPVGAISILGRDPDKSIALSADSFPTLDRMSLFLRGRRSVRQYKDENVDPALIRQLLAVLAKVPTGVNRRELTFNVIDDKAVMHRLRDKVMAGLVEADKAGRIPERLVYLKSAPSIYAKHGADILFRGAPHALIVSAPADAPCPTEDVTLALAYFDLLAQSAGLGTVWCGMLKMVLKTLPDVKALIGVPAGHAHYGMLFGIPAVRYARTVQRDDAAVVRMVKV